MVITPASSRIRQPHIQRLALTVPAYGSAGGVAPISFVHSETDALLCARTR